MGCPSSLACPSPFPWACGVLGAGGSDTQAPLGARWKAPPAARRPHQSNQAPRDGTSAA